MPCTSTEIVSKTAAIMDKYDPDKKIGLYVDEWGTWYDQEPGSHPGFLYQQNSLRDAEVAALSLNIFQRHSDRVKGANIAQMINVLQAMILTDKDKMVLTPTYHVFDMYQVFMGAVPYPATVDRTRPIAPACRWWMCRRRGARTASCTWPWSTPIPAMRCR